jgi:hypothetical protein
MFARPATRRSPTSEDCGRRQESSPERAFGGLRPLLSRSFYSRTFLPRAMIVSVTSQRGRREGGLRSVSAARPHPLVDVLGNKMPDVGMGGAAIQVSTPALSPEHSLRSAEGSCRWMEDSR